jgi:hypothetical protein
MASPRDRVAVASPPMATAAEFVRYLDALGAYVEAGVQDYLQETDIHAYIESGALDRDLEVRKAVMTIRRFMDVDDFPWWEEMARNQPLKTYAAD